ncbi:phytoene/squalene synthase family protein [Robertmurraya korlensis]|uniref:phytoene/squalene synthase family protein n=1 Tax=Robertmurraya korlensis TaxID=519977 RepID=UPI00203EA57C|nr:phytoene/squalene synthase family protein [Robertmurraya korlensis]MCM3602346.1 phytoene/squalene synthase family protein [Robertmurraya korlensis]
MITIEDAYLQCERVIQAHSETFYKAFSYLPQEQKKAVWAIYSYCRIIDDIIDGERDSEEGIKQFEEEFELFKRKQIGSQFEFMWIALLDVFVKFEMEVTPFEDMIKGQRMDLQQTKYETLDEVLQYSYHVASTVGIMLLPVLAPKHIHVLREGAIQLGLAMQLTNILRDIGEDLSMGRIYIPKEMLLKHHYSYKELLHYEVNDRFIRMWEDIAEIAEYYYEQALLTIHYYPEYSRIPVKGAALMYKAILDQVRKNEYNIFKYRSFIGTDTKEQILAAL